MYLDENVFMLLALWRAADAPVGAALGFSSGFSAGFGGSFWGRAASKSSTSMPSAS